MRFVLRFALGTSSPRRLTMSDSRALRFATSWVLLVGMLPWASGCGTNVQPTPDGGEPPEIPPASTFIIDFGDFTDGDGVAKVYTDGTDPTSMQAIPGTNWSWAALNVGAWSVIVTVGLSLTVVVWLSWVVQPVPASVYV